MEIAEAALYFEPWRFQPKTERMIELFDCFGRFGYRTVIVDWRGLFPWSEARFRGRFAYPEHAVVEAHRRAADAGLRLLARFPFGRGMGSFLSHPGYRHLRLEQHDPDAIRPGAPGAGKFLRDLLEDMLALLPELPGIYLDSRAELNYADVLFKSLLQKFLQEAGDLPVAAAPSLADLPLARERCTFFSRPPDDFVNMSHAAFPPSVELYLDLMPGGDDGKAAKAPGGVGTVKGAKPATEREEDPDRKRSKTLRSAFSSFSEELDDCWKHVRRVSERSLLPASLGYSPELSYASLYKGVYRLKERVEKLSTSLPGIIEVLEPLLAPGVYSGWLHSCVNPVKDQIAHLEEKMRIVKVWTETK